ncbi:MAG: RHS repeat-associated core domain-containing protein, partial [Lysobacter sp.]
MNGSAGELIGWQFTERASNEFEQYDVKGRLIRIGRSDGAYIALEYNHGVVDGSPRDNLVTLVEAQDGRSLKFTYDGSGRIQKVVDASGQEYIYGDYDDFNRLVSVQYPGGNSRSYLYSDYSYLTDLVGIVDESGRRYATFGYRDNNAISTEHAGGVNRYVVDYSDDALSIVKTPLLSVENHDLVTPNGVRKSAAVEEVTSSGAVSTTYTFDANGRYDTVKDASGVLTDFDFDDRGRVVKKVESANQAAFRRTVQTEWYADLPAPLERRTYDASETLVAKSAWTYNGRGQALTATRTDPVTGVTRTATTYYCEQADVEAGACPLVGLVAKMDGARTDIADVTTFTYYAADEATCATSPAACPHRMGDLWKVTNALGQVSEILSYDGAGRVLSSKDANGVVTDKEYHPRGWLTVSKVRGADDASESDDLITRMEYEPTGLVSKTILPDGSYTSFTYDAAHRLTDITDGEGNRIHYTLDKAGNKTKEDTLASNGSVQRTLSRVYNQLGQLQTSKDAYEHGTGFIYDVNGQTDSVTDALGKVTDNDYDPLSRLTRTIQDLGGINATTTFEYDAQNNLTAVIDPKLLATRYVYNGLGELTTLTSPDTGVTNYTYDSAGNRQSQTDARAKLTTYAYDALNRLTTVGYVTTGLNVIYTYDVVNTFCAVHERFATGRLAMLKDGSGTTRYCYDRFGNLTRKVQNSNGKVFKLRYAYTKAGQLSRITYPDGMVVDYQRDLLGRTTSVGVRPAGGTRQVLLREAAYYPFGPAAEWVFGNGRLFQRTLNQNYQPGVVQDGFPGGLSLGYEFDAVGNLSTLRNGNQSDPPQRLYGYDALNRLTEAKEGTTGALLQGYTYDATGNRKSATVGGITTPYTIEASSHRVRKVGAVTRGYSASGSTASIGGTARQFVYNAAGRMSQVKRNSAVAMNYRYNGKGEQVRRYLGTVNTYTAYDEAGHWLGDYDTTGAPIQQAIWLDDLPVGVVAGGKLHYVEADHLGTPRVVIDPQRDVAVWHWQLANEAFGNIAPNEDPDGDSIDFVFNMRFPGQRYDAASGINQNGFRDYDPATGRYLQSDPIGLNGGVNTYGYAVQTPLNAVDPTGLAYLRDLLPPAERPQGSIYCV